MRIDLKSLTCLLCTEVCNKFSYLHFIHSRAKQWLFYDLYKDESTNLKSNILSNLFQNCSLKVVESISFGYSVSLCISDSNIEWLVCLHLFHRRYCFSFINIFHSCWKHLKSDNFISIVFLVAWCNTDAITTKETLSIPTNRTDKKDANSHNCFSWTFPASHSSFMKGYNPISLFFINILTRSISSVMFLEPVDLFCLCVFHIDGKKVLHWKYAKLYKVQESKKKYIILSLLNLE